MLRSMKLHSVTLRSAELHSLKLHSVGRRSNSNLNSCNTISSQKKMIKKGFIETKVWVSLGIEWKCARWVHLTVLFKAGL